MRNNPSFQEDDMVGEMKERMGRGHYVGEGFMKPKAAARP